MRIDLLSLFPEYFESPLKASIVGRAIRAGKVDVQLFQLRDYSEDRHARVDDSSFGGGPGMVLMPQPLSKAIESLTTPTTHVVYLSPQGALFNRQKAFELAQHSHVLFVCGHYEGLDQRIIDRYVDEEISVGDFVLTNGCLAALLVLDATIRFIPGVLGDEASREQDSFEGPMLDHPHYTQPRVFEGQEVPLDLVSGDHKKIELWRSKESLSATWNKRVDLVSHWIDLPPLNESENRLISNTPIQLKESAQMVLKADQSPLLSVESKGSVLATHHLNSYRKLLFKEMRLPWIDKSATMGALLLRQGEILLWEPSDQEKLPTEMAERASVELVINLSPSLGKRWLQAASRFREEAGRGHFPKEAITIGSNWVCLQDRLGWRLLLKQQ